MLRVERIASPGALAGLESEWESIVADVSPYVPFRSALWNQLWWKHCRRDLPLVHDEFFGHAVRDHADRLVAVAPMMVTKRGIPGLPTLRMVQFFGADPFMTELRGPVCRTADQFRVLAALARAMQGYGREFDWVQWSGIEDDGSRLLQQFQIEPESELPNFHLRLPESWDAFRSQLPRNIKESLRKCYNSLKRDGHEFTFQAVSSPGAVPAALDRFFELHGMRADAADMNTHKNVFEATDRRAFLREFAQRMAERDQLHIFQLEIGGEVIATRIGFVSGSELYLYYSGYDVRWAKYSVMTTVTAEAIKWAIEQQMSVVNLSFGRDVSKTRWRPSELKYVQGITVSNTWRGRFAYAAYTRVRDRLRDSGRNPAMAAPQPEVAAAVATSTAAVAD